MRRIALAAIAACLTDIMARSVGRSIRKVLMIARRATLAIGAATDISIRSDTKRATSVTARTTVANSRIVSVSIAAGVTAAAGRASVPRAVRSAAAGHRVTRITTSIQGRPLLRRRIRITRCVVRGISC